MYNWYFEDAFRHYFYDLHKYFKIVYVPNTTEVIYSYQDKYVENPPPNVKDFDDLFYNHYLPILPIRKLKLTLDDYQFFCDITKSIHLDLAIALSRLFIYLIF